MCGKIGFDKQMDRQKIDVQMLNRYKKKQKTDRERDGQMSRKINRPVITRWTEGQVHRGRGRKQIDKQTEKQKTDKKQMEEYKTDKQTDDDTETEIDGEKNKQTGQIGLH